MTPHKQRLLAIMLAPLLILQTSSCSKAKQHNEKKPEQEIVHKAHLVGWYPDNASVLAESINNYLYQAIDDFYIEVDPTAVKALLVPHAGHHYSGLCAAMAYQSLLTSKSRFAIDPKNTTIKRVIILAPSHYHAFKGIALPDYTAYQTPLGMISVDQLAVEVLEKNNDFNIIPEAHNREHALEVQLPFLQATIKDFTMVPLIVGDLDNATRARVSNALESFLNDDTLLVISSDFMHQGAHFGYQPFHENISNQIKQLDSLALEAIEKPSLAGFEKVIQESKTTICGRNPIRILLDLLEHKKEVPLYPRLTGYYTSQHLIQARSGDVIKPALLLGTLPDDQMTSSVSYASMVFTTHNPASLSRENQFTEYEKRALVTLARETIAHHLVDEHTFPDHLLWPVVSPALNTTAGTFVTLKNKHDGSLRGCIGSITSTKPLYQTVAEMSVSSALHDTRFSPVTAHELDDLSISITVLSKPWPVDTMHEIILGKHGIILKKFDEQGTLTHHSVFLPQVATEQKWDLPTTMAHLSKKAGMEANDWKQGCKIEIFEGFEIKEEALQ